MNGQRSIRRLVASLPIRCFSEETGNGEIESGSGPDLKGLLSIPVEAMGIDPASVQRLGDAGIRSLGHIASLSKDEVRAVLDKEEALEIVEWQLSEIGLTFGMEFSASVISDSEV